MSFEARQEQLSFARRLRCDPTDAERRLWHYLRGRQLEGFRRRAVAAGAAKTSGSAGTTCG